MEHTRRRLKDHSRTKTRRPVGLTAIILGLLCFGLGSMFDGGFFRGLCIGATVALMVLGAYLIGASTWGGGHGANDDDGGQWLPSRDDGGQWLPRQGDSGERKVP